MTIESGASPRRRMLPVHISIVDQAEGRRGPRMIHRVHVAIIDTSVRRMGMLAKLERFDE